MTQHYLAVINIGVEPTADDLTFKIGINYKPKPPTKVSNIVAGLMATMPVVLTKIWNEMLKLVPEIENGFEANLHFDFFRGEDGDWATNGHTDQKEGIGPLLMGLSKMIFTDDPVIQQILEKNDEEEPEYVQHFDPTC
ncbi:hypothetical protein [Avibacterium avium]|uniref:Uncharacterized protein n=1 Tax=Avibacterium avium TaxID=751 RepID=A0A379AR75_AVIAV|nr:hypothetical protein [Avibacterium avium]SUB23895.1 Uncharacterised protein [Avibacterium avium]